MPDWLARPVILVAVLLLTLVLISVVYAILDRLLRSRHVPVLRRVLDKGRMAVKLAFAMLAVQAVLPAIALPAQATQVIGRAAALLLVVAIGWAVTRKVAAIFDAFMQGELDEDADRFVRQRRTQLIVFRRLAITIGVVLTVGMLLTAIPQVRTVGLSLFASAGVAGIVAGVAARPAVSNLIAGIQLALTQPVRLGDAVMVEGQWGHVAEITATYVTVTTWDQRALVVPLAYLMDRPISNWTKTGTELLDTVFLYLDHAAPIAPLRQEARRILEASPLWDRRIFAVQVTDLQERCMEIRILMSAADATTMFDLRCVVREALVAWLAAEHPLALPQSRLEVVMTPRR